MKYYKVTVETYYRRDEVITQVIPADSIKEATAIMQAAYPEADHITVKKVWHYES